MALLKITEADLLGKGVLGLPDVPGLSTEEMQRRFEEVVREVVIPTLNHNADNTYDKTDIDTTVRDYLEQVAAELIVQVRRETQQMLQDGLAQMNAMLEKGLADINAMLEEGVVITDPTTGLQSSVQVVVNNLFALHALGPIKPEEFDALEILPEAFDALLIDPFDFDTNAKNILN